MINFSNTKKGNDLLNAFYEHNGFLPLATIEAALNIKRRSVFYLIKKVNEELSLANQYEIENIHGAGYQLDTETLNFLIDNYSKSQKKSFIDIFQGLIKLPNLSLIDRENIIGIILISRNYTSLVQLTNIFNVSKTTIIKDIKNISENKYNKYNLKINNTNKGKYASGNELNMRKFVFDHFESIDNLLQKEEIDLNYSKVSNQISLLEKITGNSYTDDSIKRITQYLIWYVNRIKDKNKQIFEFTSNAESLRSNWSQKFLLSYEITNTFETQYLSSLLSSLSFLKINSDEPILEDIKPITIKIINTFSELTHIDLLYYDKNLVNFLSQHLVTTVYRLKYDFQYTNPLLNQIKTHYPQTFSFTKKSIQPLVKYTNKELSDDEIALISTYFSGALKRLELTDTNNKDSVLIVCSSGIGTSQLLLNNLKSQFPTVNFIGPSSIFQLESLKLNSVKLIISTVKLPNQYKSIPTVLVPVILNNVDYENLETTLSSLNLLTTQKKQINANVLMDIIEKYSKIIDPNGLETALNSYLQEQDSTYLIKERNADLYPNAHSANYITDSVTWTNAIYLAAEPLIANHSITSKYVDQIISLINQHGDYMVLGNEIMLSHATPNDGVNSLGINFTLFNKPFKIENSKKQVSLVITLAPIDRKKHLSFLRQIFNYCQDKEWIETLKHSKNVNEFKQILQEANLLSV